MATKLEIPSLSATNMDAVAITSWLSLCEDAFEAWIAFNPTRQVTPAMQILSVGLKMEAPAASQWWVENCDELKKLATWAEFTTRVKDRFIPSTWRLDALIKFYKVRQGSGSFEHFVSHLQLARNGLSSAGRGYSISDTIMKNHLFFNCNNILMLRVCAIPNFDFVAFKLDSFIGLLTGTWNSMVAEGIINTPSGSSAPPPGPSSSAAPPSTLSFADREMLRAAGGCFRCRRTPSSPGWIPHSSRNCPGDKSSGIPPRVPKPVATIAAVTANGPFFDDSDEEDGPDSNNNNHVMAVLPSCVLGNSTDSEGEDEDEDPYSNYKDYVMAVLPSSIPGDGSDSEDDY